MKIPDNCVMIVMKVSVTSGALECTTCSTTRFAALSCRAVGPEGPERGISFLMRCCSFELQIARLMADRAMFNVRMYLSISCLTISPFGNHWILLSKWFKAYLLTSRSYNCAHTCKDIQISTVNTIQYAYISRMEGVLTYVLSVYREWSTGNKHVGVSL